MPVFLRHAAPRQLGAITPASRQVVFTRAMLLDRRITAAGLIFGGLTSATSLLLFALGHEKAGYTLGVTSALWGATIGVIRLFAEEQRDGEA